MLKKKKKYFLYAQKINDNFIDFERNFYPK